MTKNMKKYILLILLLLPCLTQAQEVNNYKVEVGQFSHLKVMDNANVVYRCNADSTGYVQWSGDIAFADAFIISPKDGKLKIQVSPEDVKNPDLPTLYVYSDFLSSVENAGSRVVKIENPAPCAEFKVKEIGNGTVSVEGIKANIVKAFLNTGNGTINLSGSCRHAEFKMVGTGLIAADRLEAEQVKCKILGGGSIGCWPLESLVAKGIGSTKIYYKGNPDKVKKSGGGKLFKLPEDRPLDTVVDSQDLEEEE